MIRVIHEKKEERNGEYQTAAGISWPSDNMLETNCRCERRRARITEREEIYYRVRGIGRRRGFPLWVHFLWVHLLAGHEQGNHQPPQSIEHSHKHTQLTLKGGDKVVVGEQDTRASSPLVTTSPIPPLSPLLDFFHLPLISLSTSCSSSIR